MKRKTNYRSENVSQCISVGRHVMIMVVMIIITIIIVIIITSNIIIIIISTIAIPINI